MEKMETEQREYKKVKTEYEVIDKELKIAACRLADLTMEQTQNFLKQWKEGTRIGTLTLFFDRKSGYVVLNKDNEDYDLHLALAEKFMSADRQEREKIYQKAPKELDETLLVLKNARVRRVIDREIFRAKNNLMNDKDRRIVTEIINDSSTPTGAAFIAFRYGVMCGKRAERAKRRGRAACIIK